MSLSWKRTGALLLLVLLLLTAFGPGVRADERVDVNRSCSLRLSTGAVEDLKNAHVVLDLYRVAVAQGVGNNILFTPVTGLEGLGLENIGRSVEDPHTLAGTAAAAVLDKHIPAAVTGAAADSVIPSLPSGLYLVLARGQDVEDYVIRDANGAVTATVAQSEQCRYQLYPELVSLPYRSDAQSPWVYEVTGALKAAQERLNGVLELSKTLESYNPSLGTATFVFDVEADLDRDGDGKAERVYSDVLSLAFSAKGTKTLNVELPVGAQVTVSEVYTGESYERVGGGESQKVTMKDAQSTKVHFTNRWNGGQVGGTSVTNHFAYSAGEGQWIWKPLADSLGE